MLLQPGMSEATVIALRKERSYSVNGYIKNIAVLFLVDRTPRQNKGFDERDPMYKNVWIIVPLRNLSMRYPF